MTTTLLGVLTPSLDTIRLFLHVLAAGVWVGGQIVLAGVVPSVRKVGPEATSALANAFQRIAWPAYVVALATGIWNLFAIDMGEQTSAWNVTFGIKFLLVIIMGLTAVLHSRTSSRALIAFTGALGGVVALVTLFLGSLLSHPG